MDESIEEKFQQWLRLTFSEYVLQDEQTKWLRRAFFGGFEAMFCTPCPKEQGHKIQDEIDRYKHFVEKGVL